MDISVYVREGKKDLGDIITILGQFENKLLEANNTIEEIELLKQR